MTHVASMTRLVINLRFMTFPLAARFCWSRMNIFNVGLPLADKPILTLSLLVEKVQRGGGQLAVYLLIFLPAWAQLCGVEEVIAVHDQFNNPAAAGWHDVVDNHRHAINVWLFR